MAVKTGMQAIVANINSANGLTLSSSDIYIKDVVATTAEEQAAHGGANTKALVAMLPQSVESITGEQWVFYNRLNLASVVPSNAAGTALSLSGTWWASELYLALNSALTLSLRPCDIQADSLTATDPYADFTATLNADVYSPAYIGSTTYKFNRMGSANFNSANGTYASFPPGKTGAVYSQVLMVSGNGGPYTAVALSSGTLPPGLSLTFSSGRVLLSGTPTQAGTYTFTYQLTPTTGGVPSQTRTVQILAAAAPEWDTAKHAATMGYSPSYSRAFRQSSGTIRGHGSILGSFNLAGGKYYFEYAVERADSVTDMELGIATSDFDYTVEGAPSDSPYAWVVQQRTGAAGHNGVLSSCLSIIAAYEVAYRAGYYIQVAVDATDMSAVKVWFGRSGTFVGDPANGLDPAYTFDATGKSLYAIASLARLAGGGNGAVYLYMDRLALKGPTHIPTGFNPPYSTMYIGGSYPASIARGTAQNTTIASVYAGSGSYTLTKSGTIPPGCTVTLGPNYATLTGTPTTAGTYNFSITANGSDGQSTTKAFTIVIT